MLLLPESDLATRVACPTILLQQIWTATLEMEILNDFEVCTVVRHFICNFRRIAATQLGCYLWIGDSAWS